MAFRPRPPSYSDTNLEEKDSTIVNPRGEPSPSTAWSYGQPMIEIVQLLEAGRGRVVGRKLPNTVMNGSY